MAEKQSNSEFIMAVQTGLSEIRDGAVRVSVQHASRFGRFLLGVIDKDVFLEDLQRQEPVDRARNFSRTLRRQTAAEEQKKAEFERTHPDKQYSPSSYLLFLALGVSGANKEVTERFAKAERAAAARRYDLLAQRRLEQAEEDIEAVVGNIPVVAAAVPLMPTGNEQAEKAAELIIANATAPVDVLNRNIRPFPQQRPPSPES